MAMAKRFAPVVGGSGGGQPRLTPWASAGGRVRCCPMGSGRAGSARAFEGLILTQLTLNFATVSVSYLADAAISHAWNRSALLLPPRRLCPAPSRGAAYLESQGLARGKPGWVLGVEIGG